MSSGYAVRPVSRSDCEPFILEIHYAKRFPSVSYRFGLFHDEELVGVVTYGTPFSSTLRKGICGEGYELDVLELNRLVLKYNRPNEASRLVGKSLRQLPKNKIIVSYADTAQDHLGVVYQATNFLYSGLSAKRTDMVVEGKEHLHSQSVVDEFRGQPNRAQLMRDKYGDAVKVVPRPRKHRYVFFHGDKKWKKQVLEDFRYPIKDYPRGG